jgi:hypothetical protein
MIPTSRKHGNTQKWKRLKILLLSFLGKAQEAQSIEDDLFCILSIRRDAHPARHSGMQSAISFAASHQTNAPTTSHTAVIYSHSDNALGLLTRLFDQPIPEATNCGLPEGIGCGDRVVRELRGPLYRKRLY